MAKKTEKYVEDEVKDEIVNEVSEEINEKENLDTEKETRKESLREVKIVHNHSTLDYESRGFASEKAARDFVNTEYFKNLGEADREEFMAWLKN